LAPSEPAKAWLEKFEDAAVLADHQVPSPKRTMR